MSAVAAANTVIVSNQFGSAKLKTGATSAALSPFVDDCEGSAHGYAGLAAGAESFHLLRRRVRAGSDPVQAADAGVRKGPVLVEAGDRSKWARPGILCLPTTKIANGVTYKAVNPQAHLLCYSISRTPTVNPVFDQNQFGGGKVVIHKTALLCLPSTKVVVGPSG